MRFTIDKKSFARGVDIACGIAARKATRPILECARIEAAGGRVTVEATDLSISTRHGSAAEVSREGCAVVEAQRLRALLAGIDGEEVEVDVTDGTLRLSCEGRAFRVTVGDAAEWPHGLFPATTGPGEEIDGLALGGAIEAVAVAAAQEGARYTINGVALDPSGYAVATDGKRLHAAELPRVACKGIVVLPTAAATVIGKHASGPLRLWLSDQRVTTECGGLTVSALPLQGRFPPWGQVIPPEADTPHVISFARDEMVAALKAAQRMTSKDSFAVRVAVGGGRVKITSRVPGVGDGSVTVPLAGESAAVTAPETAVNPAYVLAALGAMGDTVTLRMGEAGKPMVLSSGSVRAVTMPIDLA